MEGRVSEQKRERWIFLDSCGWREAEVTKEAGD